MEKVFLWNRRELEIMLFKIILNLFLFCIKVVLEKFFSLLLISLLRFFFSPILITNSLIKDDMRLNV
jgi:hypothetical protein